MNIITAATVQHTFLSRRMLQSSESLLELAF